MLYYQDKDVLTQHVNNQSKLDEKSQFTARL